MGWWKSDTCNRRSQLYDTALGVSNYWFYFIPVPEVKGRSTESHLRNRWSKRDKLMIHRSVNPPKQKVNFQ